MLTRRKNQLIVALQEFLWNNNRKRRRRIRSRRRRRRRRLVLETSQLKVWERTVRFIIKSSLCGLKVGQTPTWTWRESRQKRLVNKDKKRIIIMAQEGLSQNERAESEWCQIGNFRNGTSGGRLLQRLMQIHCTLRWCRDAATAGTSLCKWLLLYAIWTRYAVTLARASLVPCLNWIWSIERPLVKYTHNAGCWFGFYQPMRYV